MFRKSFLGALLVLALWSTAAKALKAFSLPLTEAHKYSDPAVLVKRQKPTGNGFRTTDLVWNDTAIELSVDIAIGSDKKNFRLGIGIGNSWTWIPRRYNETLNCLKIPRYYDNCDTADTSGYWSFIEPVTSTSYTNLTNETDAFTLDYPDGRFAVGDWVQDDWKLGQTTINDVNFGVANTFNATPYLGLGKSTRAHKYPTFLEQMVAQDLINSLCFGFYFNDARQRSDSGKSITFGGVDTAKFTGPLKTYGSTYGDSLPFEGARILRAGEVIDTPIDPVTSAPNTADVNFGTSSLWLPPPVWNAIIDALGAAGNINDGFALIDYVPPDDFGLEVFLGQNTTIFIPFVQMLWPLNDGTGYYYVLVGNSDTQPRRRITLGNPFFRSTYIFFDYTNNEISIASALYNQTNQNIIEVGINNGSVTLLDLDPKATETPTDTPSSPTSTLPPPTDPATPEPQMEPRRPIAAIVGGAVGGVAVIAILLVGIWLFRRRSQRRPVPPEGQVYPSSPGDQPPPMSPLQPPNETFKSPLANATPISPGLSPTLTSPHSLTNETAWSPMRETGHGDAIYSNTTSNVTENRNNTGHGPTAELA